MGIKLNTMITDETQRREAEQRRQQLIAMIILPDNLRAELDRLSRETAEYDNNRKTQKPKR